MKNRITGLWDFLSTSFWFVPVLMALVAVALSFITLALDNVLTERTRELIGYSRGPEGARSLLSTIAGSVITVTGVTFSITIATLTQASSQFGPRLLRNFISDKGNQVVLGTFTATFLYCLLVLRTINGVGDTTFVPHISVTVGLVLGIASIGVLIFFIHHISISLQADSIVFSAYDTLETIVDRLLSNHTEQDQTMPARDTCLGATREESTQATCSISAMKSGYLQIIDTEQLLRIATRYDTLFYVEHHPGSFIVEGMCLATYRPIQREDDTLHRKVKSAFIINPRLTTTQDIYFSIKQLVEIAVRALSPGINDPYTAMNCIDWLSQGLNMLGKKGVPSPFFYDKRNVLRIITQPITFQRLVDTAFHQIRQAARTNTEVTMHLLQALAAIASNIDNKELHKELFRHAVLIERGDYQTSLDAADQQRIKDLYQNVIGCFLRFEA